MPVTDPSCSSPVGSMTPLKTLPSAYFLPNHFKTPLAFPSFSFFSTSTSFTSSTFSLSSFAR
ncbi:unnamed protein product [Tuber melanosporum]|uniref:(Perigord truffle) hypothetical protein n=1 Tax=Tuber melanosporum (strain Mel28) TaxID=656061 RepID=D5GI75_TUBMM|nr:uncharacterized protein GSTUM_00008318001 [Tuber melanosporum]CAZ84218.1 unnamed protein product [Tuber melanosporum]